MAEPRTEPSRTVNQESGGAGEERDVTEVSQQHHLAADRTSRTLTAEFSTTSSSVPKSRHNVLESGAAMQEETERDGEVVDPLREFEVGGVGTKRKRSSRRDSNYILRTSSRGNSSSSSGSSTNDHDASRGPTGPTFESPRAAENLILRIKIPYDSLLPRLNIEAAIFVPEAQRLQQVISESVRHIVTHISLEPTSSQETRAHPKLRGIREQRQHMWGIGGREASSAEQPNNSSAQRSPNQDSPPRTPPRGQRVSTPPPRREILKKAKPRRGREAEADEAVPKPKPKNKRTRAVNDIQYSHYQQPQDTPVTRREGSFAGEEVGNDQIASHAPRRHREVLLQRRKSYIKNWGHY